MVNVYRSKKDRGSYYRTLSLRRRIKRLQALRLQSLFFESERQITQLEHTRDEEEQGSYYDRYYDYDSPSENEWERGQKTLRDSFVDNSDTVFNMSLEQYTDKFKEFGFVEVLRDDFTHSHCGRPRQDTYFIYAHKDGFLLTVDTYTGDNGFHNGVDQGFDKTNLNTAELHYNWKINSDIVHRRASLTSSGGFISYPKEGDTTVPAIWAGNHDVREGLKYAMEGLKANGEILNPWVENRIHWLTSHQSVLEKDRSVVGVEAHRVEWNRWKSEIEARSQKNFDALPEWVQTMIGRPKS